MPRATTAGRSDEQGPFPAEPGPGFTGLVNLEIAYEEDFKHYHSNWDRYERRDFNPEVEIREQIAAAGQGRRIHPFVAAAPIIFIFGALGMWALLAMLAGGSSWYWLLVAIAVVGIALTFRWADEKLTDALFAIKLGPLKVLDLVGRPLRVSEGRWFFFFRRKYVEFKELSPVRIIWLGSGQIQFGCGPKGICVEHHGGFLYLIGWERIELVYPNDDQLPQNPFCDRKDPRLESIKKCLAGVSRPERGSTWARPNLRVRLSVVRDANRPAAVEETCDEILIPYRFFGDGAGDTTVAEFYRQCWIHKLAAEHEHEQEHGAAITVLPQHALDTMIEEAAEEAQPVRRRPAARAR